MTDRRRFFSGAEVGFSGMTRAVAGPEPATGKEAGPIGRDRDDRTDRILWADHDGRRLIGPASPMAAGPEPESPGSGPTSRPSPRPSSPAGATRGPSKARAYLIGEFRKLGLEPLFDGSYTQDVTGKGPEDVLGVNVGAKARRVGPGRRDAG